MKIISWNANCKFREKYKEIAKLNGDVYVIQECEDPERCQSHEYKEFVRNGFWIGDISFKGLLVFSPNPNIRLKFLDWNVRNFRYFLPVRVNDIFTVVGSWACKPYIEEFCDFIHSSKSHLTNDTIIIGDINSNVVFDKEHIKTGKTHSIIVKELKSIGFEDIYHYKTGDEQGKEKVPTFYLYRHLDKAFHIDHCFATPEIIKNFKIHARWQWLMHSDHLPLEIETT